MNIFILKINTNFNFNLRTKKRRDIEYFLNFHYPKNKLPAGMRQFKIIFHRKIVQIVRENTILL